MAVNDRVATSVGLGATQAITLWLALTPPLREVFVANQTDEDFVATLRHGEIVAGIASLGVGIMASMLSGSALPTVTALLMVAVLYGTYEYTLVREGLSE